MFDDLKGKTVVTGSSKGLGAAMAWRFGAEGTNVVTNQVMRSAILRMPRLAMANFAMAPFYVQSEAEQRLRCNGCFT